MYIGIFAIQIIRGLIKPFIQPALGLLLADGAPAVGLGKTFWRFSQVFFYENGRDSEMKRLSEGYKQAIDKIWSPIAKNGYLGQNSSF